MKKCIMFSLLVTVGGIFNFNLAVAQEDSQESCRGQVNEIISTKSVGRNEINQTIFTEINSKLQMYHDVRIGQNTGLATYNVTITNGHEHRGWHVCSCVLFENAADNLELASIGGRWGIKEAAGVRGSRKRAVNMSIALDKASLQFIDRVTVQAGYCPNDDTEFVKKWLKK